MTDRLLFALLTTGWGASFFFTAIALRSFTPVGVVVLRMALAAAVLTGVVLIRRPPLPAQRAAGHLVVLGGFNIALPFLLLTAAQQHVTSSLTVVLSATTPVFVFLFAGLLRAEPFSGRRLLGVALSFAGVTVLSGWHGGGAGSWGWPLVVVLSSALYAAGNVYTRRHLAGLNPLVIAWGQITASLLYLLPAAALAGECGPRTVPACSRCSPSWSWGCSRQPSATCCSSGSSCGGGRVPRRSTPTCSRSSGSPWACSSWANR